MTCHYNFYKNANGTSNEYSIVMTCHYHLYKNAYGNYSLMYKDIFLVLKISTHVLISSDNEDSY